MIFLSGDRHFGELLKIERPGAYPLLRVHVEPAHVAAAGKARQVDRANPDIVPGTLVAKRQFGLIRVSGPGNDRRIAFEARDTEGSLLWRHEIGAGDLRFPRNAAPRHDGRAHDGAHASRAARRF